MQLPLRNTHLNRTRRDVLQLGATVCGLGTYGSWGLPELAAHDIVALCDVDWRPGSAISNNPPGADYTHAIATITAMKMGKHVYCEKPLARTVLEVCLPGDIAIRHKGTILRFDAKNEKFLNSVTANRMFEASYREGWKLPT